MFKNWPLAVAAYNCGQGRVKRALQRSNSKSFWELVKKDMLPKETVNYVPSIIAVTIIAQNRAKYGI